MSVSAVQLHSIELLLLVYVNTDWPLCLDGNAGTPGLDVVGAVDSTTRRASSFTLVD